MRKAWLHNLSKGTIHVLIAREFDGRRKYNQYPLKSDKMYEFNFKTDIFDDSMIKYYKQLEKINIKLYIIDEPDTADSDATVIPESVSENSDVEVIHSETTTPESEEVIVDNKEKEEEEEKSEEIDNSNDADTNELIAYLDVTYNRDELKDLATEWGLEFSSRISTDKLIAKMVDEKRSNVLALINNQ